MPAPTPHQRRQNKKGCLIALGIVGGLFAIVAILITFAVYRATKDPKIRKAFSVLKEGMSVTIESMNAPGTEALREAGCKQAMVIDTERLNTLMEEAGSGEAPEESFRVVICHVNPESTLDCPTVAQVYGKAIPDAPDKMMVQVQEHQLMKSIPRCNGLYAQDGTLIEALPIEDAWK